MNIACCPRLHARALTMALLLLGTSAAEGKISDCKPIADGQVLYRSHANYVEAYDNESQQILWHTELFSDKYRGTYDPKIEEDVQWNIAYLKTLQGEVVTATDGNGKRYNLDKNSGRVVDSQ